MLPNADAQRIDEVLAESIGRMAYGLITEAFDDWNLGSITFGALLERLAFAAAQGEKVLLSGGWNFLDSTKPVGLDET